MDNIYKYDNHYIITLEEDGIDTYDLTYDYNDKLLKITNLMEREIIDTRMSNYDYKNMIAHYIDNKVAYDVNNQYIYGPECNTYDEIVRGFTVLSTFIENPDIYKINDDIVYLLDDVDEYIDFLYNVKERILDRIIFL